jgi:hypothetical protein
LLFPPSLPFSAFSACSPCKKGALWAAVKTRLDFGVAGTVAECRS